MGLLTFREHYKQLSTDKVWLKVAKKHTSTETTNGKTGTVFFRL